MTRPAQYAKKLIKLKFMPRAFEIQSNSCGYLLTPGLILTLHRPNGFLWAPLITRNTNRPRSEAALQQRWGWSKFLFLITLKCSAIVCTTVSPPHWGLSLPRLPCPLISTYLTQLLTCDTLPPVAPPSPLVHLIFKEPAPNCTAWVGHILVLPGCHRTPVFVSVSQLFYLLHPKHLKEPACRHH